MASTIYNDLWDMLGQNAWGVTDPNNTSSPQYYQNLFASNRGLGNTKGIYKKWNPDKEAIDKTLAEAPNIAAVADYATYDPNLPDSVIAAQKRGAIMTGEEGVAKNSISEAMRGRMAKRLSKINQKNTNNAAGAQLAEDKYKAQMAGAQVVHKPSLFEKITGNPLFSMGLNLLGGLVGVPGAGSMLGGAFGGGATGGVPGMSGASGGGMGTGIGDYNPAWGGVPSFDPSSVPNFAPPAPGGWGGF